MNTFNAVGIDISKGKSMIAVLRPMGEVVSRPVEVQHTNSDLARFVHSVAALPGETKVLMEHTGRYHQPIAYALHKANICVCAINPLLLHESKGGSLHGGKTDKRDAIKIAKYALEHWAELPEYGLVEATRAELQMINRQLSLYIKNKVALTNNLIALLDQTYPNVNTFFDSPPRKDGHQKWVDFASTFWHADCVRGSSRTAFSERYHKWCKRNGYCFNPQKADAVYSLSLDLPTILAKTPHTKLLVVEAARLLTVTTVTISAFQTKMLELASQLPEYQAVMGMYGVGEILGPRLMAEIGDVLRFRRKQSLAAMAGVDPKENQSGTYDARRKRISKRGSPHLRKALFQVMDILIKNSPAHDPVYLHMDKLRAAGKPYYLYMIAGANKFLRIYYGKVKAYLEKLEHR